MMNINELMKKAQGITENGLPFMQDKEKLEVAGEILNTTLTVDEYGFMKGEFGEYVVMTLQEYPQHFIQGASVVTQAFKTLEETFSKEEIETILEHGLTFKLSEVKSKNKKTYVKIDFFPKED